MEQERGFYITWCSILSGYAESYFETMEDQQLIQEYERLAQEEGERHA